MSGTLKIGGKTLATHDTSSNQINLHSDILATTTQVQGVHATVSAANAANTTQLTSVAAISGYSLSDISVGDYAVGERIIPGTTVTDVNLATGIITLSQALEYSTSPATAALSGDPVSFYNATKALSAGTVAGGLCRAWVNFNGTNNVIRASFNVQSLTDNGGNGRYTINFINNMPDNNYAVAVAAQRNYATGGDTDILTANIDMSTSNDRLAASSVSVACAFHSINSLADPIVMTVAIFR